MQIPHVLQQHRPRHDLALVAHQIFEHLELTRQQLDFAPGAADRAELVERLTLMLSGVVAARRRRYVMMNATVEALPAIREVLPSMRAPTVLPLADEGQIAVHAAVDAADIWSVLPALKAAGASSILVLPVERLVP